VWQPPALGNFLSNIVDGLSKDVRIKRVMFIEKNCEILQEFPFAHLPRESHRYFMEELGGTHAQTMLYTRFVSFIQSIRRHPKFPVQFMLNLTKDNILSVTGKNIRKILTETGHDDIFKVTVSEIKKNYNFCAIEEENK
jgi:hypothetical protein